MDTVTEIKTRLPIEELVGQYCQLHKKGRGYVCVCPFHNDKHPSMQVSPDKGIAYCFACQTGGDIFSFYQAIERVDFRQAIKDLAEKTGVQLPDEPKYHETKDEKERLRQCLETALEFYRDQLKQDEAARKYLLDRGVAEAEWDTFELGVAPDSFSATYDHLLKTGCSRSDVISCGLASEQQLQSGKAYDRFRHRLMFPIRDAQGKVVGFSGRTLGNDDAKYINSPETPLYHKSNVLYGWHLAKDAVRKEKALVLVEGYFDVLACHRVGITNVAAVSGTALTEAHVAIIQRSCERVVLCLDQDRAGRMAAERAFTLLAPAGLQVQAVALGDKDPADVAQHNPEALKNALTAPAKPFVSLVIDHLLATLDLQSLVGKTQALETLLPLLRAIPSAVEREHFAREAAGALGTTETAIQQDIAREKTAVRVAAPPKEVPQSANPFTREQIALGLFVLYPSVAFHMTDLIATEDEFSVLLRTALAVPRAKRQDPVVLEQPWLEKLQVLLLWCEQNGLDEWSDSLAAREVKKLCHQSNQEVILRKQKHITQALLLAQREGRKGEEEKLRTEYQQVLKLMQLLR